MGCCPATENLVFLPKCLFGQIRSFCRGGKGCYSALWPTRSFWRCFWCPLPSAGFGRLPPLPAAPGLWPGLQRFLREVLGKELVLGGHHGCWGGGTMTTGLLRDAAAPGSPVLASPQNPSPIPEGQPGPRCLLAQSAGHHQAGSIPVNVSSAGWKTRWEPPWRRRGRTRGRRRGEGGLCANKIRAGGVWRGRGRWPSPLSPGMVQLGALGDKPEASPGAGSNWTPSSSIQPPRQPHP